LLKANEEKVELYKLAFEAKDMAIEAKDVAIEA